MRAMLMRRLAVLCAVVFGGGGFALGQIPVRGHAVEASSKGMPVRGTLVDPATEKKIDDLLKDMTLEEKVGQLALYSVGVATGPGTGRSSYDEMIEKGEAGCLYNLADVQAANHYQHLAMEKSRLHIPVLYGLDVIHGYRTIFPAPLGLASTWDPAVVEKAARVAAQESSAAGVRWTFSPMVDIARDPRWGRMVEGAGEDPYLGSAMARAYVRGYQGNSLSAAGSIASCAKHFVGYGAAEGGRDYNSTEISEHTLREVYLPPFYAALDEGGASVMSAFNSLNGVPSTANPFTLTQILRKEWRFSGVVVSDWTSVSELMAHGIANDGKTAARKAFQAGLDMDMESGLYHEHLADLVKNKQVSEDQLNDAVRYVLRLKFALGLFENPYTDESRENQGPLPEENLKLARRAAERSFVLLKNDTRGTRRVLPLSPEKQTFALIGPLADDADNMLGPWAGRGMAKDVVTLKTAMLGKFGAERVKYAKGGEIRTATDQQIDEAVTAANSADVAILALGENAGDMTAEAGSRAHLDLPGRQEELLEKVSATGKPVVLLLFSGRPLTLPWAFQHVPAVIAAWFPGLQGGPALLQVLLGETSPTGKLVVSWPRAVGQIPVYYNALNTGRPAGKVDLTRPPSKGEEKYVSRYVDEQNAPQFPFGYGLSYTEVAYGQPEVSAKQLSARAMNMEMRHDLQRKSETVKVSATITNRGKRATEEIVELYVRLQGTSMEEPVRKLQGFQRILLKEGESKKVTFSLGPEAFALWDIRNDWRTEPSRVTIWVSPDSASGEGTGLEIVE